MNRLIKPLILFLLSFPFSMNYAQKTPTYTKNATVTIQPNKFGTTESMDNGLRTQNMNFIFKMDQTPNTPSFTPEDAQLLHKFVVYGKNTLNCSEAEKQVITIAHTNHQKSHLVILDQELRQKGYTIHQLTCAEEEVVFNIGKLPTSQHLRSSTTPVPTVDQAGHPSPFTTSNTTADCLECKEQQLPEDVLSEWKNLDQENKPLIDFSHSFTTNTELGVSDTDGSLPEEEKRQNNATESSGQTKD